MSRQRRAHRRARPATTRYAIRAVAVLTLVAGVAAGMRLDESAQWQQDSIAAGHQAQIVAHAESAALTLQQQELHKEAQDRAAIEAKAAAARAAAVDREASRRGANRTVNFGPIPKSCSEFSGNRAIGCALVLEAGMDLTQMACLNKLWTRESGWNHKAENKTSGAYGIPQALPGDKMESVADDWRTNPVTQIKWGLGYIKNRHKTPCGAWAHSEAKGWY